MTVAFQTLGADLATSSGTIITGGLNSMGSYVSLGTTSIDTKFLYFLIGGKVDTGPFAFNIGAGATPSTILSLLLDRGLSGFGFLYGPIPISIASGTELSVQCECDSSAAGPETVPVSIIVASEPIHELTSYTPVTYGITLGADAKGAAVIDPGGTVNTKGGYTELVASAQAGIDSILFTFGTQGNQAIGSAQSALIDIAIGAAASEAPVIANLQLTAGLIEDQWFPSAILVPGNVFAGQRISARAQCSVNDATDRLITIQALTVAGTPVSSGGGGGGMRLAGMGGLAAHG